MDGRAQAGGVAPRFGSSCAVGQCGWRSTWRVHQRSADLEVSHLSTQTLQTQLRGRAWILESANLTTLVARFDLAGAAEGPRTLNVHDAAVNLPPGVVLESVAPQTLSLRLVRRSQAPVRR